MRKINWIILALYLASANSALAFDAKKIIDKMKKAVPSSSEIVTNVNNESASIRNLTQSFENLTNEQKNKLAIFRLEHQKILENLVAKFELLPKEVQDLLKEEKKLRLSLSPKGQEELDNYIKEKQHNKDNK